MYHFGPVYNTHQRVFDTYIQEFSYTPTASGHPPEGTTLTGPLQELQFSPSTLRSRPQRLLCEILSGYPCARRRVYLEWWADNILAIGNFAFVGLVMSLPNVTSGQTGSISQNGTVVSLSGSRIAWLLQQYQSRRYILGNIWSFGCGQFPPKNPIIWFWCADDYAGNNNHTPVRQPSIGVSSGLWTPCGYRVPMRLLPRVPTSFTSTRSVWWAKSLLATGLDRVTIKATSGADGTVTHKVIKEHLPSTRFFCWQLLDCRSRRLWWYVTGCPVV